MGTAESNSVAANRREIGCSGRVWVDHGSTPVLCGILMQMLRVADFVECSEPEVFSGSEAASINQPSLFGARSLMARDIAKTNADRHLNPGLSVWNFRDGVIGWLFHGDRFSDPKQLLRGSVPSIIERTVDQSAVCSPHVDRCES